MDDKQHTLEVGVMYALCEDRKPDFTDDSKVGVHYCGDENRVATLYSVLPGPFVGKYDVLPSGAIQARYLDSSRDCEQYKPNFCWVVLKILTIKDIRVLPFLVNFEKANRDRIVFLNSRAGTEYTDTCYLLYKVFINTDGWREDRGNFVVKDAFGDILYEPGMDLTVRDWTHYGSYSRRAIGDAIENLVE
jgi:hypothetical protein